jgi:hypothetical protein
MVAKKGDSPGVLRPGAMGRPGEGPPGPSSALKSSAALKDAQVKASDVNSRQRGFWNTRWASAFLLAVVPTAEALVQRVRALLDEVKAAVGAAAVACRVLRPGDRPRSRW